MEPRKLYRSTRDSVLGGVCGGLAEYFDIDPVLVRVVFVILALVGGGGVLLYLILWIVLQKGPIDYSRFRTGQETAGEAAVPGQAEPLENDPAATTSNKGSLIAGLILLTLGFLFLLDEFIPLLDFSRLWPVILIVIGAAFLINAINKKN